MGVVFDQEKIWQGLGGMTAALGFLPGSRFLFSVDVCHETVELDGTTSPETRAALVFEQEKEVLRNLSQLFLGFPRRGLLSLAPKVILLGKWENATEPGRTAPEVAFWAKRSWGDPCGVHDVCELVGQKVLFAFQDPIGALVIDLEGGRTLALLGAFFVARTELERDAGCTDESPCFGPACGACRGGPTE